MAHGQKPALTDTELGITALRCRLCSPCPPDVSPSCAVDTTFQGRGSKLGGVRRPASDGTAWNVTLVPNTWLAASPRHRPPHRLPSTGPPAPPPRSREPRMWHGMASLLAAQVDKPRGLREPVRDLCTAVNAGAGLLRTGGDRCLAGPSAASLAPTRLMPEACTPTSSCENHKLQTLPNGLWGAKSRWRRSTRVESSRRPRAGQAGHAARKVC